MGCSLTTWPFSAKTRVVSKQTPPADRKDGMARVCTLDPHRRSPDRQFLLDRKGRPCGCWRQFRLFVISRWLAPWRLRASGALVYFLIGSIGPVLELSSVFQAIQHGHQLAALICTALIPKVDPSRPLLTGRRSVKTAEQLQSAHCATRPEQQTHSSRNLSAVYGAPRQRCTFDYNL